MGKWRPESCHVCDFRRQGDVLGGFPEFGCQLGIFETVDLNEAQDKNHAISQAGKKGRFYLMGTMVDPDDQSDGRFEPVVYNEAITRTKLENVLLTCAIYRYRELGDMDYESYYANPYEIPEELDEEDTDGIHAFIEGLPDMERNALHETNFNSLPTALIHALEASWEEEGGYKVKTVGRDAAKVFCHSDETACIYGQSFGRPFYRTIEDQAGVLVNQVRKGGDDTVMYTVNVNVAKKLGIKATMITYATGDIWAPSKNIVMDYKYHGLDEDDYTELYLAEMRVSYATRKDEWLARIEQLKENPGVYSCFCNLEQDEFCHRLILAYEVLPKFGIVYGGEITSRSQAVKEGLL